MKRTIGIVCLLAAMVVLLGGCGKFTCAKCNQEVRGKKNTLELVDETFTLCNDCYDEYIKKRQETAGLVKDGMGDITALF